MFLFLTVKIFEVTLWFLSFSFFKLTPFSSFKRVINLSFYYIWIPFLFIGRIAYFFAWLLLDVFKASEIVIKADCRDYYFIETFRVSNHCYRALDLWFQFIKKSRYPGSVVLDNSETIFIKFNQILWYRSRLHKSLEFLFRRFRLVQISVRLF